MAIALLVIILMTKLCAAHSHNDGRRRTRHWMAVWSVFRLSYITRSTVALVVKKKPSRVNPIRQRPKPWRSGMRRLPCERMRAHRAKNCAVLIIPPGCCGQAWALAFTRKKKYSEKESCNSEMRFPQAIIELLHCFMRREFCCCCFCGSFPASLDRSDAHVN